MDEGVGWGAGPLLVMGPKGTSSETEFTIDPIIDAPV